MLLATAGCTAHRRLSHGRDANALVVAASEPVSLDPLYLEGIDAYEIGELGFSYLTNYDANGAIVPDLAREVPTIANGGISADRKRITFHLRRGILWQDGSVLTSGDVVFTYRAVMSPRNAIPSRYGYDKIASVKALGPYTVVVTTRTPYSPIMSTFFGGDSNYPILPAHLLAQYASLNRVLFNRRPIGSGPYRFDGWAHGDHVTLVANPHYFAGRPAIAHIDLRFVTDSSTIVNQLMTGEIDAAFFADASRIATLRHISNHRLVITPVPFVYSLDFNLADPVIADKKVRRALALAIDRPRAVAKASRGLCDARTGMRGVFTWAFDPFAGNVPYAPAAAAALLASDGWVTGADGIRSKGGRRLDIRFIENADTQVTDELATIIAAEERSIGAAVTRQHYSRQTFDSPTGPLYSKRYQLAFYDAQSTWDPDLSYELACNRRPPAGFNTASYCNPAVDAALAHAVTVFDRKSRFRDYAFVQRQIVKDLPYYFLCQVDEVDVIPSWLRGYQRPLLSPFNSIARWRYAK